MCDDLVGLLHQVILLGTEDYVVAIGHVMQTADDAIREHCFVSHYVAIGEEGIPPLFVVGYHAFAKSGQELHFP